MGADDELRRLRLENQALRERLADRDASLRVLEAELLGMESRLHDLERSFSYRVAQAVSRTVRGLPVVGPAALATEKRLVGLIERGVVGWKRRLRAERRAAAVSMAPPLSRGVRYAGEVAGRVSVVLPVYNQASLLPESVASVLGQTWRALELVIVDDGSTDDIDGALASLPRDPRLRVVRQPNQGLPKALSNGFELATGQYWTWTSADNLMEPQMLERLVAGLESHPEAGMVYADYLAIDDRGQPLADPAWRSGDRAPGSAEVHVPRDPSLLVHEDNFIGPSFLYRGWIGRLFADWDPDMGTEDYDYWLRLHRLVGLVHLGTDEVLYRYRVHDNTLSARAGEHRITERRARLFARERARAEFVRRPFRLVLDERTGLSLEGAEPLGASLPEGKVLLVIAPETLAELPPVPDETLVVAYAADPRRLHRHRVEVRRRAHVGVAADPSLLDQLGLLLPQALLAADGPTLRSTLEAVANDRLFFERTRGAAARDRQRPTRIRRERPRILLQVDRFIQGGLEQVVLDLAEVLLAEGLDPRLLILGRASQAADSARQLGLPIVSLPVDDRPAAYRELLARERISLVNAHYSLFGAALAAEAGVPFVQTVHNTYCWLSPKELELEREAARHTTLYACVSQSVALYSARILGLPTERLRVVPNGVEVARHGPLSARARQEARAALGLGPEDVVILNVATLSETKAQLPLVLAFAEVAAAHPRAKLLSVGRTGDESYAERIRDVIERQGLADRVLLVGHRDDAPTLYGASDLFCLPSYWEGDSLAMAEAALSGLHLVATDVGSARELIAEVGGTLVDAPFGSVIDLEADTQRRWLDDPEALCRLLAPRLAAALTAPTPPVVTEVHRHRLDRRQAYRAYASLFASLLPA